MPACPHGVFEASLGKQEWIETGLLLKIYVIPEGVLAVQADRDLCCHCGSQWGCFDPATRHPVLVTGKDTSHLCSSFPLVWCEGYFSFQKQSGKTSFWGTKFHGLLSQTKAGPWLVSKSGTESRSKRRFLLRRAYPASQTTFQGDCYEAFFC